MVPEPTPPLSVPCPTWLQALLLHPLLAPLDPVPRGTWLVGGAIRDAWLSRQPRDLDLVVPEPALESLACHLAEQLRGRLLRLEGHRTRLFRVISALGQLDLTPWSGEDLETELGRRDFTIHAMGLELSSPRLIDPFSGLQDLTSGRLRCPRSDSFLRDPLRVLRLARFEVELPGFRATPATRRRSREAAPLLFTVPGERLREELHRMASLGRTTLVNAALVRCGAFPLLWAETPRSSVVPILRARSLRLEALISLLPKPELLDRFGIEQALRFGVLIQDLSNLRKAFEQWLRQQRLSRAETRRLLLWATYFQSRPRTQQELRELLYHFGSFWQEGLLLLASLDRDRPLRGWEKILQQAVHLVAQEGNRLFSPKPFLSPQEVAELLRIQAGPELGAWLEKLRLAQVRGVVRNPEAARRYLRKLLSSRS